MSIRIRELRKQRKLTMKELGSLLGFSEVTVSQYETEKRQPNIEALIKFSNFFGVTVGYLLGAEDIEQPAKPETLPQQKQEAYSEDEIRMVEIYRTLSQQGKDYIFSQLNIAAQVYTKNTSVSSADSNAG